MGVPRYQLLDAVRGVSCLAVVAYHAAEPFVSGPLTSRLYSEVLKASFRRLDIGVILFFVVSGFCVCASADALRKRDNFPIAHFFVRRFKRIYPPYWCAFVLYVVIAAPLQSNAAQWVGNLLLWETWRPYLGGGAERLFLPHAWSLCYEEQFYAVMGLCILLGRFFFAGLIFVSAVSMALFAYALQSGDYIGTRLFFDYHWLYFALGIAVYWVTTYKPRRCKTAAIILGFLTVLSSLCGVALGNDPLLWFSAAAVLATAMLLCFEDDAVISKRAPLRVLGRVGVFSYSLYLIHPLFTSAIGTLLVPYAEGSPIMVLVLALCLGTSTSLVAASFFFSLAEKPWQSRPS